MASEAFAVSNARMLCWQAFLPDSALAVKKLGIAKLNKMAIIKITIIISINVKPLFVFLIVTCPIAF